MQWVRRSFVTGFFVTVPLIVSVAALWWAFQFVDGFATPIANRLFGRAVPGVGVLVMATLVLGVGALATNVIGNSLATAVVGKWEGDRIATYDVPEVESVEVPDDTVKLPV